jgi:hypothetical protein
VEAFNPRPLSLSAAVLRTPFPIRSLLGGRPALAQKAPIKWESVQLIDNPFYKKKSQGSKLLSPCK